MQKNIFLLLCLLTQAAAFAQSKKLTGDLFMQRDDSSLLSLMYADAYLLVDLKPLGENEQILQYSPAHFDIEITAKQLKKYQYLEFNYHNSFTKIIKLDTLKTAFLKTVLVREKAVSHYKEMLMKKPAIYLYPSEKTEITVKHDFKGKILTTYPQYVDKWRVIAEPNGVLYNINDKRTYNYLFWDGEYAFSAAHYAYTSGFCVKNEDLVGFLQEKLDKMGLNNTEINDFIVFWLPLMNQTPYNFIHFGINDNIDNSSFLHITPKPDTELRVFMEYKGLQSANDAPKLPEQTLPSIARKGFVMVEWGGGEIVWNPQ
jgi:hypothetical protein